ncbi:hypothetical protein ACU4GR_08540 (plasmid) [Methylobacterium oryzae CBMB20]
MESYESHLELDASTLRGRVPDMGCRSLDVMRQTDTTAKSGVCSMCGIPVMFDVTKMLADALGEHIALIYQRTFGSREPRFAEVIEASARLTIERIVGSDALYHDGDHTALVTLVAQDILRGRFLDKGITPEDWLHMILAALYHDIGYVRGVLLRRPGERLRHRSGGHHHRSATRRVRCSAGTLSHRALEAGSAGALRHE